jgi:diketogulonate reductase-like aldo/keto reductase
MSHLLSSVDPVLYCDTNRQASSRAELFDRLLHRLLQCLLLRYLPTTYPSPGGARRQDMWRALEKLHADGKARAIGVSNFMPNHLADIFEIMTISPAVNQFECHIGGWTTTSTKFLWKPTAPWR